MNGFDQTTCLSSMLQYEQETLIAAVEEHDTTGAFSWLQFRPSYVELLCNIIQHQEFKNPPRQLFHEGIVRCELAHQGATNITNMPFPFTLPTTSYTTFTSFLSSTTHPSLPLAATEKRTHIRDALKSHKRLPPASQVGNISSLLSTLEAYIPYIFALDAGLSGRAVGGEEIDLVLLREIETKWRCTLTSASLGRDAPRTKVTSLDAELCFVLQTCAFIQSHLAREALRPLYRNDAAPLEDDARAHTIARAMRCLLSAHSIHKYLFGRASDGSLSSARNAAVADLSPSVLGALASLAMAEATLIAVLKDDPYPVAVAEDRNKNSRDWMFKSPDLSTSRSSLLVRICMGAAQHAADAVAGLRNARGLDEDLISYADDLKRTARAKAARFQGIAVETQGKTGEGIAWIKGAKHELGILGREDGKPLGFSRFKKDWKEKKEDKRIIKGDSEWGIDAGKLEESRVLDMLEKKWIKMNDTMTMQTIPQFEPLLANLPSGREFHKSQDYNPPKLEQDGLVRMRGPPDYSEAAAYRDGDDSNSEDEALAPVGAFPGTANDYTGQVHY